MPGTRERVYDHGMGGPSLDYSHVNKFLSSVGLGLMAVAVLAVWTFFQSLDALTLSSEEIAGLTHEAQETILQRQELIGRAQIILPWGSALLFLFGLTLTLLGSSRWWSRQKKDDQDLDERRQHEREQREFEKAPREEVDARREVEIDEGLGVVSDSNQAFGAQRHSLDPVRDEFRTTVREVTRRWQGLMEDAYSARFTVRSDVTEKGVQRGTSSPRGLIDLLLDPPEESSWGQLGIELKVLHGDVGLLRVLRGALPQARQIGDTLRSGRVYTGRRGQPPMAAISAVVVVVRTDEGPLPEHTVKAARTEIEGSNGAGDAAVGVLLVNASDLESADADDVRRWIATLWTGGEALLTP